MVNRLAAVSLLTILTVTTPTACSGPSDQARPLPTARPAVRLPPTMPTAPPSAAPHVKPVWEIVATSGRVSFVYVPPKYIRNRAVIASALHAAAAVVEANVAGLASIRGGAVPPAGPLEIDIFDSRAHTPRGFPMTDAQMAHWRAQYSRNPHTGLDRFVWIKARGDRVTSTPDSIRPAR